MDALIVCSLEPWDDVWRRNQFLVRELLLLHPDLRVLFVAPAFDIVHTVVRRQPMPERGLRRVPGHERLWQLRPLKALPRIVGPMADRSLAGQVLKAADELDLVRPVLWINDVGYSRLLSDTSWPALYDITDDWLHVSGTRRHLARIARHEAKVLREADAVVVCSPALAASRGAERDVVLIGNGVERDAFLRPGPRPDDLPTPPTAVYVGTLHADRLDLDLCCELAERLPRLSVVFIGPIVLPARDLRRLASRPNIYLLGERPFERVAGYLQHADVIVVPHTVNDFTESLDPIKAYECLAVDTATVATPVAGFRELADELDVVAAGEFVGAVERAISAESRRRPTRMPPTWSQRAKEFSRVLVEVDRARPPRRLHR